MFFQYSMLYGQGSDHCSTLFFRRVSCVTKRHAKCRANTSIFSMLSVFFATIAFARVCEFSESEKRGAGDLVGRPWSNLLFT